MTHHTHRQDVSIGHRGSDGYFSPDGAGSACLETEPCNNPFTVAIEFDEYILAAGEYSMTATVELDRNVTYRGRDGDQPAVIKGASDSASCFSLDHINSVSYSLTFHHLVIECPTNAAFFLRPFNPINVELSDVVIRNSFGGFVLSVPATGEYELSSLRMTNVQVRNTVCGAPEWSEPMILISVDWAFDKVSFIDNCVKNTDTMIAVVQDCNVTSSGGTLLFQGNGGKYILRLQEHTIFTMHGADMLFENNTALTLASLEDQSSLRTNGMLSFKYNSVANQLLYFPNGSAATLHSLLPIQLQGNNDKPLLVVESPSTSEVCITPCEEGELVCDCNDRPLLSWSIPSTSLQLPSSGLLALPLLLSSFFHNIMDLQFSLELSDGLVYGQHFTTQPPPFNPNHASVINVSVEILPFEVDAQLNITQANALPQEEVITIRVAPNFWSDSFFVNMTFIQVFIQPSPPPSYQPDQATVLVTFPNPTKPDHTLSFLDPQDDNQTLTNRSVSAQFATLMEVDEDGEVVAMVSLKETEFEAQEFDNVTFNLNNALPFFSFSTNITVLTMFIGNGEETTKTNLTESIIMEVEFTMFVEEQVVSFAGVEQVMAANTLKWSLLLSSWPFQHPTHSLELHLFLSSEDGPISSLSEEQSGETQVWVLKLGTENTEIPVNVLPLALLLNEHNDEQPQQVTVSAEWKDEAQELVIRLPWFGQGSLLLDPDMSLLVAEESKEEDDEDDGLWWKVTVPVVLFVILVAGVAVAVVVFVQKKQSRKTINQRAHVNY
ncbi:hypothetical protein QOT17_011927 [Balamuthia mandrillaris]